MALDSMFLNYVRKSSMGMLIVEKDCSNPLDQEGYLLQEANNVACGILGINNELCSGKRIGDISIFEDWNLSGFFRRATVDELGQSVFVEFGSSQLRLIAEPVEPNLCICIIVPLSDKVGMQKMIMEQHKQIDELQKKADKKNHGQMEREHIKDKALAASGQIFWKYDIERKLLVDIMGFSALFQHEVMALERLSKEGLILPEGVEALASMHQSIAKGEQKVSGLIHFNKKVTNRDWLQVTYHLEKNESGVPEYAIGVGEWLRKSTRGK